MALGTMGGHWSGGKWTPAKTKEAVSGVPLPDVTTAMSHIESRIMNITKTLNGLDYPKPEAFEQAKPLNAEINELRNFVKQYKYSSMTVKKTWGSATAETAFLKQSQQELLQRIQQRGQAIMQQHPNQPMAKLPMHEWL